MKKIVTLFIFSSFLGFSETYDPKIFYGVAKTDNAGNILHIEENASQTHDRADYVIIRVRNIKVLASDNKDARIRIATWDSPQFYAKEGEKPLRACSFPAKDNKNGEMVFKMAGLSKGKSYAFFAHHDRENLFKVARGMFGIPKDPYIFSNNLKTGVGLGKFGPPPFEKTAIKYERPGQEIIVNF